MIVFAVLLVAYVFSQFFRAFTAAITAELTQDIGLSAAQLGNLSAIWFAVFALMQFPVGLALDRLGPRRTVTGTMLAAVAGTALFALAPNYPAALAGMGLIGVGCSAIFMGGLYVIGRTNPPQRFAMLSSVFIGLGSLGNLVSASPFAYAVAAYGWRASLLVVAALTAVCTLLVALLLRDPVRLERPKAGSLWSDMRSLVMTPGLWRLLPMVLVSYAVVAAERSIWISKYFGDVHGYDTVQRGNAAVVMALAMALGGLSYGPLERAIGAPKPTVIAGSLITTAAFLVLGLSLHLTAPAALALIAGVGGFGLTYAIVMAHGRLFFPDHILGRGVTFLNFLFIAGVALAQTLSGAFVEAASRSGAAPVETYAHLHLSFGIALAGALLVYVFAPAKPHGAGGAGNPTPPS